MKAGIIFTGTGPILIFYNFSLDEMGKPIYHEG